METPSFHIEFTLAGITFIFSTTLKVKFKVMVIVKALQPFMINLKCSFPWKVFIFLYKLSLIFYCTVYCCWRAE